MKKCGFLAVLAIALLVVAPAATAQSATCTAVTPANSAFNAALLGNGFSGTSGSPNGFANVNFSLNGNQATVNASSLGLTNITGITLFLTPRLRPCPRKNAERLKRFRGAARWRFLRRFPFKKPAS